MAGGALRSAWRHWRRLLGQAPQPPDAGLVPARAVQVLSAAEPDPTTVAAGRRGLQPSAPAEEWSFRETVVLRKSRRASSLMVWGTVGFTGALLLWAVLAPLPETIAVQGKLEPGSGVKDVEAPVPGVVEAVLVKEGELVSRGQPLVRFDLRDARSKLAAAEAVRSRLQRENQVFQASFGEVSAAGLSANQRQRLSSQLVDTASRQESARQELARSQARAAGLATSLATADSIAGRYEQLASSGAVSDVQVLEARSRANDLRAELEAERRDSDRLRANLITASSSVGVDLRSRIETNLKQIAELDGQIRQARLQLAYSQLTAPSDGLVFDLDVSPGTVVQAQLPQPLLKIVPQEALQARVYLPNTSVGFVRPGQRANISLDAFNSSDFGRIPATVVRVGSDALTPEAQTKALGTQTSGLYFPAILKLDRQSLDLRRPQPLQAGMSLTADIHLRERRFIQVLTGFFEDKKRSLERLR